MDENKDPKINELEQLELPILHKPYQFRNFVKLGERKKIEEMIKNGCSIREISVFLNRPYESIKQEIYRGGGRLNYEAEYAQKKVYVAKESKYNISDLTIKYIELKEKIELLEMQIETLLNFINKE